VINKERNEVNIHLLQES